MRDVIGKLTMSIMLPTTTRRGFATHAHADTALHCNSVFGRMRRMVTTASTVTRRASNTVNREASGRERNRVVSRAKSKVKSKTKEVYLCNECGEDFSQWYVSGNEFGVASMSCDTQTQHCQCSSLPHRIHSSN